MEPNCPKCCSAARLMTVPGASMIVMTAIFGIQMTRYEALSSYLCFVNSPSISSWSSPYSDLYVHEPIMIRADTLSTVAAYLPPPVLMEAEAGFPSPAGTRRASMKFSASHRKFEPVYSAQPGSIMRTLLPSHLQALA